MVVSYCLCLINHYDCEKDKWEKKLARLKRPQMQKQFIQDYLQAHDCPHIYIYIIINTLYKIYMTHVLFACRIL